jgi:two-component system response regulator
VREHARKPALRPILLVEDHPHDEALALRALLRAKVAHPVVVARDGVEALEWLFCTGAHAARDPAIAPALVLLDLKVPLVDGFEVLERLRADPRLRGVPTVILSTSSEERDRLRGAALGVDCFVRKSIDFEQFRDAIALVARRWLAAPSG